MGVLHESRGEHDASYREYKAALKADRQFEPALHNMQRYYERFTFGRSNVPVDTGSDLKHPQGRACPAAIRFLGRASPTLQLKEAPKWPSERLPWD